MSLLDFRKKRSRQEETSINKQYQPSYGQKQSSINSRNTTTIHSEKKTEIRITDSIRLSRYIEIAKKPDDVYLSLLCPIRPAIIHCHSVYIDKLGVMTRFILQSLYNGKTIEEIQELTRIGERAIEEEIAFLVNGQLVEMREKLILTALGAQYGRLLEMFETLSQGIPVMFNSFAESFEELKTATFVPSGVETLCLPEDFSMTLTRDEDYKNSIDIAKKHISKDFPFWDVIMRDIHTTVWVSREKPTHFKKMYINDFRYGHKESLPSSIPIRIPIDRVTLKPRYKLLEKYRPILGHLIALSELASSMLTSEAATLASLSCEEAKAETIVVDVNAITGYLNRFPTKKGEDDNPSILTLDADVIPLQLIDGVANELFLEEVKRERYYETVFFTYSQMETK